MASKTKPVGKKSPVKPDPVRSAAAKKAAATRRKNAELARKAAEVTKREEEAKKTAEETVQEARKTRAEFSFLVEEMELRRLQEEKEELKKHINFRKELDAKLKNEFFEEFTSPTLRETRRNRRLSTIGFISLGVLVVLVGLIFFLAESCGSSKQTADIGIERIAAALEATALSEAEQARIIELALDDEGFLAQLLTKLDILNGNLASIDESLKGIHIDTWNINFNLVEQKNAIIKALESGVPIKIISTTASSGTGSKTKTTTKATVKPTTGNTVNPGNTWVDGIPESEDPAVVNGYKAVETPSEPDGPQPGATTTTTCPSDTTTTTSSSGETVSGGQSVNPGNTWVDGIPD